jgi:hypothetical protein
MKLLVEEMMFSFACLVTLDRDIGGCFSSGGFLGGTVAADRDISEGLSLLLGALGGTL